MTASRSAREFFAATQDAICRALERIDGGGRFHEEAWEAPPGRLTGGGGVSRVLAGGHVFEKAGVNLADVRGTLSERIAARMGVDPGPFVAAGVSLVVHPRSPMVPTVHMNLRRIALQATPGEVPPAEAAADRGGASDGRAWFGGGADLTPYYLFPEDAAHFHEVWKQVCDRHDPQYYPRFKSACDEYFHLRHRGEARGVGGIFFDYLDGDPERVFAFVRDAGEHFLDAYLPLVERRNELPFGDGERQWQLARRGRYVEFNLLYDRGTLFGLETGGRVESILMSMPPLVAWPGEPAPPVGPREAELLDVLRRPRTWV